MERRKRSRNDKGSEGQRWFTSNCNRVN